MLKRLVTKNRQGFTLIELLIVISIIGILASIAVPNYQVGVLKAREAVLREDLYNIRNVLDQFYVDQGKWPDSLQELMEKKYLRAIPADPFTKKDDWVTIAPEQPANPPADGKGIGNVFDVKSNSNLIGTNGVPYNEW